MNEILYNNNDQNTTEEKINNEFIDEKVLEEKNILKLAQLLVFDEKIKNNIFQKWINGEIEDEKTQEYEKYLIELTSYSIEKLQKEPEILKEEESIIKQEMEQLACKNYKAFIQTSNCIQDIHQELSEVNIHLNSMLQNFPKLNESCKNFVTLSQKISQKRYLNRLTLQNYTQLLELLEIPQLMDTYIRNSFYEEALKLEAYSQKLKRIHPNISIIQDIVEEVQKSTKILLFQLHQQLKTNIQLPICLKVISYLRRLGIYNEHELRLSFLQNRKIWFQNELNSIPITTPYEYLTKFIDASRIHLFDIITQYRAIFSDDTSFQDENIEDGGLLYGWINQIISEFLEILTKYLPQISESLAIQNLLDQSMYYGFSLGRVGVDFRGLLIRIFEKNIFNMFCSLIDSYINNFIYMLKTQKLLPPTKIINHLSSSTDQMIPPISLMDYPHVAILCNGYLSTFNEIRQCVPFSLKNKLAKKIQESFFFISITLQNFQKESKMEEEEKKLFEKMCQIITENLIPYIIKCFNILFPSSYSLIDIKEINEILETLYEKSLLIPNSFHTYKNDYNNQKNNINENNNNTERNNNQNNNVNENNNNIERNNDQNNNVNENNNSLSQNK